MSCFHPMVLVNTSDMTDPKQRQIVEKLRLIHKKDSKVRSTSTIIIPREVFEKEGLTLRESYASLIPCGHCIGCKLDYSREWAIRCMKECEQYEENYFVTLTYDDDHLPVRFLKDRSPSASLIPDDVSDFMKSLRKNIKKKFGVDGVRFFACGEYGSNPSDGHPFRPHYHIILFNCPISSTFKDKFPTIVDGQLKYCRRYDSDGSPLYYSDIIQKSWNKGLCPIGNVTFESCAYVSRYVTKKLYGEDSHIYVDLGIEPEFVRMSRRPGIGYNFFISNLDHIYEYDNFNIKRGDDVINVKPGKYCDKLLKNSDEQLYYDVKKKRRLDFYDSIDCKTFANVDVRINNHKKEYVKEHSVKLLKRCL